jgi:hypothetical protein
MIVVRTMASPDGVLGLNGWWYLEELGKPGVLKKFDNEEKARLFIEENGEDPDSEWIEYRDESHMKEDELK